MKTKPTKTDWEKEFDENVNYDEAESGCNWGMEELKAFIHKVRQQAIKETLEAVSEFEDAAEMLWITLANVSEGDWNRQSKDWQRTVVLWRDNYFRELAKLKLLKKKGIK